MRLLQQSLLAVSLLTPSLGVPGVLSAQEAEAPVWNGARFQLVENDPDIAPEPSARAQVGPFGFDFFCHAYGSSSENLQLAVTPAPGLAGKWRETFLAGGFDGTAQVSAGPLNVGQVQSATESATGKVIMTFVPGQYDLTALISGEPLSFGFVRADGENTSFRLNVGGGNIGPTLCPVVSACGRDVSEICAVFGAVDGVNTYAAPQSDTLDSDGNPRWFKSAFTKPEAAFPYYRTASVVDPEAGAELHLSCIAREGKTLAVHLIRRAKDDVAPLVTDANPAFATSVGWETGGEVGMMGPFGVIANGDVAQQEGVPAGLMTRAMLESFMTTDTSIKVQARHGEQSVFAEFSSTGSRDAICHVMKGCSISMGLSPACNNR